MPVGKGTVFVPAPPHGWRPINHIDPEEVELFGPSRAERVFDAPLPWVSPTATHVAPLRGAESGRAERRSALGRPQLARTWGAGRVPALPRLRLPLERYRADDLSAFLDGASRASFADAGGHSLHKRVSECQRQRGRPVEDEESRGRGEEPASPRAIRASVFRSLLVLP